MSVALDFVKCLEYQLILNDQNVHLMMQKEKNKVNINKSEVVKKLFQEQKQKFLQDESIAPVLKVRLFMIVRISMKVFLML
jgi:hypothetical protein